MDNFYVTLPSTATPGNTQASFITHLPAPLDLSGSWEVGLSEIHLLHRWDNIDKQNNAFTIKIAGTGRTVQVAFIALDIARSDPVIPLFQNVNEGMPNHVAELWHNANESTIAVYINDPSYGIDFSDHLIKTLGIPTTGIIRKSTTLHLKHPLFAGTPFNSSDFVTLHRFTEDETHDLSIPTGWYETSHSLFNAIKEAIPEEHRLKITLSLNANRTVFLQTNDDLEVKFGSGLRDMLGFTGDSFMRGQNTSKYQLELSRGIHGIFVYTDIILPQLVGDTYAPLLRVVPVSNEKKDEIIVYMYDNPDYYPLSRNAIESILVYLRSENGDPIVFRSGKTLVKLHFRRRR